MSINNDKSGSDEYQKLFREYDARMQRSQFCALVTQRAVEAAMSMVTPLDVTENDLRSEIEWVEEALRIAADAAKDADGRTDMVKASRILLTAAWRLSIGMNDGLARMRGGGNGGPDDPINV